MAECWFKSQLLCFQPSFLQMGLGKQWKMAQVLGSLPLPWKTWMEFWAPGFTLAQSQLLWTFEQ